MPNMIESHEASMNPRLLHIGLSCILSAVAIAIGGYLSKNDSVSFFNSGNLFGHGLFVLFIFPVYCVSFYWLTYPFFRVQLTSVPMQQERTSGSNSRTCVIFSTVSVVFSIIGFLIPPFALIGIFSGHAATIRLRVIKSPEKGRFALAGLILGHLALGFWVLVFLLGLLGAFG